MEAAGETVVIRADASDVIGFGHVSRCLSLAAAIRRRGCRVVLRSRGLAGGLRRRAEAIGCELLIGDGVGDGDGPHGPGGADAHAAGEQADAEGLVAALAAAGIRPSWVVVDGYGFGAAWHGIVRGGGARILCIDDLADRPLDCDLLLDQNLVDGMHCRYENLLPSRCRPLLGPRFAVLPAEYAELRRSHPFPAGETRRVLISFGGADRVGATLAAVEAFGRVPGRGLAADVILARTHPQRAAVESLARADGRIRIADTVPTLAPLLAAASLSVGGAGVTAWERLCLGVPSIAVAIAENQRPIAAALAAGRLAWVCDGSSTRLADELADAMQAMLSGGHEVRIEAGMRLCDGLGADRVAAAMLASAGMPLMIRSVEAADCDVVLAWANDPETRRASLTTRMITEPEHAAWFAGRIAAGDSCVFLMATTADGVPVGNVRLERRDEAWLLSFVLAPEFRGFGLGRRIVGTALAHFTATRGRAVVDADVRHGNEASRRILEALGFRPAGGTSIAASYRCEVGAGTTAARAEEAA